ncbi:DinB family protein [Marinicrinis lubricantis]|uniref:DinB family protein n=1 Tax=Marinicrinis lubricantis TaxID=2086470 RepID=A0ABW1IKI0_9BACL
MNFDMGEAAEVLQRTPYSLKALLSGLSESWLHCNEGEGTWTAAEVIDHLIESERTNWIPRLEMILREGEKRPFPIFDRFTHLQHAPDVSMDQKLKDFIRFRTENIAKLKQLIDPALHLELTGVHPAFGVVKLRELLSAWVVHDFTHMAQIVRVMAKRYTEDTGPWIEYLSILKK